jgi:predicted alpha/beta-fold hydrolase
MQMRTPDADGFHPPFFLRNRHVQTILGHLWAGPRFRHPTRKHLVALGEGDHLVLHDAVPARWRETDPIAVLIHGLGGNHDSGHLRRFAHLLTARHVRSFRADLRGTGEGLALARKSYHAGRSEDIRLILEYVHALLPASPLLLIGVSLGGNMVVKLAGEAATNPIPGLQRVVALGPPIDLARCDRLMSQRSNLFYNRYFTRLLVSQARAREKLFPDLPRVAFPASATLRQFDELYTAPRNGFAGVEDYYARASSAPVIPAIKLPTLILTARDDPFVDVRPFEALNPPANVELRIADYGGHLGFVGRDSLGGMRWGEAFVVRWLLDQS